MRCKLQRQNNEGYRKSLDDVGSETCESQRTPLTDEQVRQLKEKIATRHEGYRKETDGIGN